MVKVRVKKKARNAGKGSDGCDSRGDGQVVVNESNNDGKKGWWKCW